MERLTAKIKRPDKEDLIVYTKGIYEDTIPAEMTKNDIRAVLKKLAAYEDTEEQRLLLRLPYPLGTEYIYFVDIKDRKVYRLDAEKIEVNMTPIRKKILYTVDGFEFLFEDFEKAVFLTREEAEAKLKETEGANVHECD